MKEFFKNLGTGLLFFLQKRDSSFYIYYLLFFNSYSFFTGICAKMTAANTNAHPHSCLPVSTSFKITQPANTEITDSKLKIKDATAGFVFFCPRICKVYATPQDMTPAYKIGTAACIIDAALGLSVKSAMLIHTIPLNQN